MADRHVPEGAWKCEGCGWTNVGYVPECDGCGENRATAEMTRADLVKLYAELERQQEMWTMQSRVISALAAEVPDDVRARVLAPLTEADDASR